MEFDGISSRSLPFFLLLTSHQQRGHMETGPRFKVPSERPENRGIDLTIPGPEVIKLFSC